MLLVELVGDNEVRVIKQITTRTTIDHGTARNLQPNTAGLKKTFTASSVSAVASWRSGCGEGENNKK